ncbi:hypothetical protein PybrP1_006563 [[Pythium] brassicae (nom. inval.)]|nr:hypothetical protein PybrP1_006563 [[Pythium] brassicae (nom. inval.)]
MGATTTTTRDSSYRGETESSHLPSALAPLVHVARRLDRRSPVTLSVVVAMVVWHVATKQIVLESALIARVFDGGSPVILPHATAFIHESSVSFGWTGYCLEKKLGSLRFLLVLGYLLLLSQLLLASAAFVVAKALLANGSLFQWSMVMTRQYPALAPTLDTRVPTSYVTWIELLGVHFFLPRLTLLSQVSGLAAGYLFTALPGTMKAVAKCELQVDRALRKQGIKLPVKHRWKLVLADFQQNIRAAKWWPRLRRSKAAQA